MKDNNSVVFIRRSPGNDKGDRFDLLFPAAIKVAVARRIGVGWFRCRVRLLERVRPACYRYGLAGHLAVACDCTKRGRRCVGCGTPRLRLFWTREGCVQSVGGSWEESDGGSWQRRGGRKGEELRKAQPRRLKLIILCSFFFSVNNMYIRVIVYFFLYYAYNNYTYNIYVLEYIYFFWQNKRWRPTASR